MAQPEECKHPKRIRYSFTPDVETPFAARWWCPDCNETAEIEPETVPA